MEPSIKILLVEDNPSDAEMLQELLLGISTVQFEWVHVPSLNDAINHLREDKFDAILLDLSRPDSHGQEPLARAYAQAHAIHVVLGYGEQIDGDLYTFPNINRKMQGMDLGSCNPLYHEANIDISHQVAETLNAAFRSGAGAGGVTPVSATVPSKQK